MAAMATGARANRVPIRLETYYSYDRVEGAGVVANISYASIPPPRSRRKAHSNWWGASPVTAPPASRCNTRKASISDCAEWWTMQPPSWPHGTDPESSPGRAILERLVAISSPYGTQISIRKNVGIIRPELP